MLFAILVALFEVVAFAGRCPTPDDYGKMSDFAMSLAAEGTTEEAQTKALRRLRRSERAVRRARALAPKDAHLVDAEHRLGLLTAEVNGAETPMAVARAFDQLSQPTSGGCDFSVGEVIAIVLGFILGVIPGIILLILLC